VYGVALTVLACLRSGTRADVAWLVEAEGLAVVDWSDAVVFTPGGGRIGEMAGGAFDGQLADQAGRRDVGRLIDIEVSEIDALIAGLPSAGSARCLLVPAAALPEGVWDLAVAREPIGLVCTLEGDEVADISLYTTATVADGGETLERLFSAGKSGSMVTGDQVVSVFRAAPQLVVVGDTDVAAALVELASRIGWNARVASDARSATGMIATLSGQDKVVVTAHDLELAGSALMAALDSDVGYIGALGARRMQENRADWLAYRGVTDLSRIHGPAGLDIGADTPGEIAVSILAEAIAENAVDHAVSGSQPWSTGRTPTTLDD
jgi:xanthine dehydrogenase accessory factor